MPPSIDNRKYIDLYLLSRADYIDKYRVNDNAYRGLMARAGLSIPEHEQLIAVSKATNQPMPQMPQALKDRLLGKRTPVAMTTPERVMRVVPAASPVSTAPAGVNPADWVEPDEVWATIQKNKRNGTSIEALADALNKPPRSIRAAIKWLQTHNHVIYTNAAGDVRLGVVANVSQPAPVSVPVTGERFTFAALSDTHLVSNHQRLDALHLFYDEIQRRGITVAVHAGDLLDGVGVYRGQEHSVLFSGIDRHIEYAVEQYPKRDGVQTYLIGGNHDESYVKHAGIDAAQAVCAQRDDMTYLGMYDATLDMGGIKTQLHHGHGYSYAQSYLLQKYLEKIPVHERPALFFCGHWHHAIAMLGYQGVHGFSTGCFQGQSLLIKRLGGYPVIGAWFIDVTHDKGKILTIKPEFVSFD